MLRQVSERNEKSRVYLNLVSVNRTTCSIEVESDCNMAHVL